MHLARLLIGSGMGLRTRGLSDPVVSAAEEWARWAHPWPHSCCDMKHTMHVLGSARTAPTSVRPESVKDTVTVIGTSICARCYTQPQGLHLR
jgi:hypothetical protein